MVPFLLGRQKIEAWAAEDEKEGTPTWRDQGCLAQHPTFL